MLLVGVLCVSNGAMCQCGGVRELHDSVATGDFFGAAIVTQWDSRQHSSEYPTDAFGELQFAGAGHRHSHVSGRTELTHHTQSYMYQHTIWWNGSASRMLSRPHLAKKRMVNPSINYSIS